MLGPGPGPAKSASLYGPGLDFLRARRLVEAGVSGRLGGGPLPRAGRRSKRPRRLGHAREQFQTPPGQAAGLRPGRVRLANRSAQESGAGPGRGRRDLGRGSAGRRRSATRPRTATRCIRPPKPAASDGGRRPAENGRWSARPTARRTVEGQPLFRPNMYCHVYHVLGIDTDRFSLTTPVGPSHPGQPRADCQLL